MSGREIEKSNLTDSRPLQINLIFCMNGIKKIKNYGVEKSWGCVLKNYKVMGLKNYV